LLQQQEVYHDKNKIKFPRGSLFGQVTTLVQEEENP